MAGADRLVAFLAGDGVDNAGRRVADILARDDIFLETRHDFIQWLFPLDEPSRAVPGSPWLDASAIVALKRSATAIAHQRAAAIRMLDFYRSTSAWLRPFDHNHLRITRIIRSLRMICGDADADAFRTKIFELSADTPIDSRARKFWGEA